jgi:hypothetical protein
VQVSTGFFLHIKNLAGELNIKVFNTDCQLVKNKGFDFSVGGRLEFQVRKSSFIYLPRLCLLQEIW